MEEKGGGDFIDTSVADFDSGIGGFDSGDISDSQGPHALSIETIQSLVLVHHIRADVVCQHSTNRKCGYLIQPKVWFTTMNEGIEDALKSIGLKPKKSYVRVDEITRILHSVRPYKWMLKRPKCFAMVQLLNGRLEQPRTHEEVLHSLDLLDKTWESL